MRPAINWCNNILFNVIFNFIIMFTAVVRKISTMTLKHYSLAIVFMELLIACSIAQQNIAVTFPNAENQSAIPMNSIASINTIPNTISNIIASPIVTNTPSSVSTDAKRNEWWPPSEQEMTQTLPYTSDVQPIPAAYYIHAPPPPPILSHYRSEQWSPYGYPESPYPVIPPNPNNQIGVTPKYMAIALFIGLLTLFAIIQGSLMSAKQKEGLIDVNLSRKKRDLLSITAFENMVGIKTPEQQDVFTNDEKIRCIQRTICVENRELIKDFGPYGIKLAKYLTRSVKKSLQNASGWDRLVEDAGGAGLRGENCDVLYRDCVKYHPPNNS